VSPETLNLVARCDRAREEGRRLSAATAESVRLAKGIHGGSVWALAQLRYHLMRLDNTLKRADESRAEWDREPR
jgi:hypothetical protein